MSFQALGLYSSLVRAVAAKGYTQPTPVQAEAIPIILSGRDLIASAQTGTGKTAAFALPILHRLGPPQPVGPRVLILEPTRELAAQVDASIREFSQFGGLRTVLLHGGVGLGAQRTGLIKGADIVVATVGRLLDLLHEGVLRLEHIQILVLDEVDRMLDLGFIDEVRDIVTRCPRRRQTLFFSATIPPAIEDIARFALQDPARVSIGRVRTVSETVTHAIYPVSQDQKYALLLALLAKVDFHSVIVFTRTKRGADVIVQRLKDAGHKATVLHGDRSQGQRKASLAGFKEGRYEVLVATDLAARGLDIAGVSHVINYDIPLTPDDYVHRIGRTGRAEAHGDAFTLATPREARDVQDIERFIRAEIPRRKLAGFDYQVAPAFAPPPPRTQARPEQPKHSSPPRADARATARPAFGKKRPGGPAKRSKPGQQRR